jgi:hypothetical protein
MLQLLLGSTTTPVAIWVLQPTITAFQMTVIVFLVHTFLAAMATPQQKHLGSHMQWIQMWPKCWQL